MLRRSIILIVSLTCLWATASPSAQPATRSPARDLAGTWTLSLMERLGARSSPVTNPLGLLVYDAAGHVLEIATRGGRALYAAAQATPADAHTHLPFRHVIKVARRAHAGTGSTTKRREICDA